MLVITLAGCAFIWGLILVHQINRRGVLVLTLWLLVAPLASQVTQMVVAEPADDPSVAESQVDGPAKRPFLHESKTRLKDMIEPTRLLFGVFAALMVANVLIKRDRLSMDRTEAWMAVFAVLLLLSALCLARRPLFALRTACDAFLVPFVAYAVARRLVTREDRLQQLLRVVGYMGVYVIGIALVERLSHPELIYRLRGPFPTGSTLYAVLASAFFLVLVERRQGWSRTVVLAGAPVMIVLTMGRAHWLAFLLAVAVCLWMARRLAAFPTKTLAVGLGLLGLGLAVIAVPLLIPDKVVTQRIANTRNIASRFATWTLVLQEGFDSPALGLGLTNLRHLIATEEGAGGPALSTAHNSFLSVAAELGVTGLLVYAAVLYSLAASGVRLARRGATRQDRWRGVALVSLLVAYVTPALFANTMYISMPLHHVYVYAYAGALAARHRHRTAARRGRAVEPVPSVTYR